MRLGQYSHLATTQLPACSLYCWAPQRRIVRLQTRLQYVSLMVVRCELEEDGVGMEPAVCYLMQNL